MNAIIAFGMTLVILIGGIDLSVGAVLALVGVVTVTFLPHGLAAGLGMGMLTAAVIGAANGALAARTRMPPFIITLAMMLVARGAAMRFNEGRPLAAPVDAHAFFALGTERLGAARLPTPVVFMAALSSRSPPSCCTARALGSTCTRSAVNSWRPPVFTGIPLARHETAVYLLSASFAGVAGIIQASQLFSGEPSAGQGFELNAIAAAVVGGTSFTGGVGSIPGTLLGAIIIGILDKGLNQAGVHFLQSVSVGKRRIRPCHHLYRRAPAAG